jgi:hypothetical protein
MERCSKKRTVLAPKFMLVGARGLEGQYLTVQQLPDNHRKCGHVDVLPLSGGGGDEELAKQMIFVARFSWPNAR